MPYTASQTPSKAPARAGLLCCGGWEGGGGGISTTKEVKKGSIYLYGVFPAAGHHANAGEQRGAGVSVCKRLFFGHRPPSPAGHGADPRGGHLWEPAVQVGFTSLLPNARPRTQPLGLKFGSALPETRELCCSALNCTYAGGESLPICLRCIGEGCFYGTSRVSPPHYPLPVP